ncbi:MAG: hypothetical protein OZ921_10060 [Sorangiineae bacterium]|nr:hypothetical protein [Polyangiaceae bacterium]MEB2322849.1 hypothetical protein [Sorangiineae bacterium]
MNPSRLAGLAFVLVASACGARTGLHVPPERDAGRDAPADAPDEEAPDAAVDAAIDAAIDAPEDVFDAPPDRPIIDCVDAGITYVYLISSENRLLRFYPPSASFHTIGNIACPAGGASPFSMAVDREGIAFVLYNDGELFRVSTLTASCERTGFVPGQQGFPSVFGMGFVANAEGGGETLYVAGTGSVGSGGPAELARVEPATFELTRVGQLDRIIGDPELTGTGEGNLYAFAPGSPRAHLSELEPTRAAVRDDTLLDLGSGDISAWAFAFWGGDFYFFTSKTTGESEVNRYTPGGTTTPPVIARTDTTIVGAGVSTCAPSR